MRFTAASLVVSTYALAVNAHFSLNYPPTRGFDHDKENQPICGGFENAGNRSLFPLNDGWVSISTGHPKSILYVAVSFENNPKSFAEFNKTSDGKDIPAVFPFHNLNTKGDACVPVNIGATGLEQAKNGTNATILVQFDGGDGNLYQCADVILSDTAQLDTAAKCTNSTGVFAASGTSATSTAPASSGTSSSSGSNSAAGSNVALPVALAGVAAVFGGVVALF